MLNYISNNNTNKNTKDSKKNNPNTSHDSKYSFYEDIEFEYMNLPSPKSSKETKKEPSLPEKDYLKKSNPSKFQS